MFIKISSGHINQVVGAVILQLVAALVGGTVLLLLKLSNSPLPASSKGIWFAVLAGAAIGIAEIGSFFLFSKGVPVSVGMPIIVGGSIVATTLLGVLFLKESISILHLIAIALTIIGVGILSAK